jgi:hypothetical protein
MSDLDQGNTEAPELRSGHPGTAAAFEAELRRYHGDMLDLILALDEMMNVYWGAGDGELPEPVCIQRARRALEKARASSVGDYESAFDDMAYRFSCVLDHATGGRLSKTNYTKEVMYAEIDAHISRCVDELRDDVDWEAK